MKLNKSSPLLFTLLSRVLTRYQMFPVKFKTQKKSCIFHNVHVLYVSFVVDVVIRLKHCPLSLFELCPFIVLFPKKGNKEK